MPTTFMGAFEFIGSILGIFVFLTGSSAIRVLSEQGPGTHVTIVHKESVSPGREKDIYIQYPQILYKDNPSLQEKINRQILDVYAVFDMDPENIDGEGWGYFKGIYEIASHIENVLSIRIAIDWYGEGAAHGNLSLRTLNFNLETGEQYTFKDLFRIWAPRKLVELIVRTLQAHDCRDQFSEINVSENKRFYLYVSHLIAVFIKYEIAAGVCGPIEVPLRLSDLRSLPDPHGPLKVFPRSHITL